MSTDLLKELSHEMARIAKTEEELVFVFLIQKIINEHATLSNFVAHLPKEFKELHNNKRGYLLHDFLLNKNGFVLGNFVILIKLPNGIEIKNGQDLVFRFAKELEIGNRDFLASIATKIGTKGKEYRKQAEENIQKYKQDLMAKFEAF